LRIQGSATARRAWLAAAGSGLSLTLLAGCATPGLGTGRAALAGLPRRVELDDAPFFPHLDFQCGPAALATALGRVGLAADPVRLAEQVFLPARRGSLQLEMLAGARRQGAVATRIAPDLPGLLHELSAGHVVVVLQNLALSWAPRWHYAVVVGHDLDADHLVLRSGATRRELMSLRTFGHTWQRAGFWGFVALPPGRWPVTASAGDARDAALGFERAAPASAAEVAYRSAAARWPNDAVLAMGLGNTLAAQARWMEAAEIFRAAATRHDQAPAWINLSTVLLRLGDPPAALQAATRAAAVAGSAWAEAARAAEAQARAAMVSSR
jgi:tetratricopeptide (TPR) repeat protein